MTPRHRRTAYVGIGSNLGDRAAFLRAGIHRLRRLDARARFSSVYETEPMGPPQRRYLNMVAEFPTDLGPRDLLRVLQAIERDVGRRPGPRWGPRAIDLDVLLLGDLRVRDGLVTVPHPRIAARPFVLVPLAELAPGLEIPGAGRVGALALAAGRAGVRRYGPP